MGPSRRYLQVPGRSTGAGRGDPRQARYSASPGGRTWSTWASPSRRSSRPGPAGLRDRAANAIYERLMADASRSTSTTRSAGQLSCRTRGRALASAGRPEQAEAVYRTRPWPGSIPNDAKLQTPDGLTANRPRCSATWANCTAPAPRTPSASRSRSRRSSWPAGRGRSTTATTWRSPRTTWPISSARTSGHGLAIAPNNAPPRVAIAPGRMGEAGPYLRPIGRQPGQGHGRGPQFDGVSLCVRDRPGWTGGMAGSDGQAGRCPGRADGRRRAPAPGRPAQQQRPGLPASSWPSISSTWPSSTGSSAPTKSAARLALEVPKTVPSASRPRGLLRRRQGPRPRGRPGRRR